MSDTNTTIMKEGTIIEFDRKKFFRFIRELGTGGTGDTVLFLDETTDIQFAFKKYAPKDPDTKDEDYIRFVDEIKILFQISHPNIVRVYNYYLYPTAKTGYLQMEFIEGKSIDEFQPTAEKGWNEIFIETIEAFKYLEKKGILHRDIRPQNIMVDNHQNVKVIDFGFGKIRAESDEESSNSIILNWPVSALPSELTGKKKYDHQTEVYFLGKLFEKIENKDHIQKFNYVSIIDKMTRIERKNRYTSFDEIASEISNGRFGIIEFTTADRHIYKLFAEGLTACISKYSVLPKFNRDINDIIKKLAEIIRNCSLENDIPDISVLINVFVKSECFYFRNRTVSVTFLRNFYLMILSQPEEKQQIVLDNLITRLRTIKVVDQDDDVMPF